MSCSVWNVPVTDIQNIKVNFDYSSHKITTRMGWFSSQHYVYLHLIIHICKILKTGAVNFHSQRFGIVGLLCFVQAPCRNYLWHINLHCICSISTQKRIPIGTVRIIMLWDVHTMFTFCQYLWDCRKLLCLIHKNKSNSSIVNSYDSITLINIQSSFKCVTVKQYSNNMKITVNMLLSTHQLRGNFHTCRTLGIWLNFSDTLPLKVGFWNVKFELKCSKVLKVLFIMQLWLLFTQHWLLPILMNWPQVSHSSSNALKLYTSLCHHKSTVYHGS